MVPPLFFVEKKMASPTQRSPRVAIAPAYARTERVGRRPQNPFNVATRPFQIQPVMFHPVLPGETLKTLLIQSQVWSDPLNVALKNTGWWCEYNVFYVKHRDLPGYEQGVDGLGKDLVDMFVVNESLAAHTAAAAVPWTYTAKGGVDFVAPSLERVVDEYFRDEGEKASDFVIDGVPICQIYGRGRSDAFDKLTLSSDYEDHRVNLDADGDGNIYVGDEMNRAFEEWAAMHDAGVMEMTYEDWLKTYGGGAGGSVEPDRVDYHRPEDVAYARQFAYPTNTVDPATGVPAVAVGWRVAHNLRKAYRFDEPGWLMVTQTVRPKVYLGQQKGSVASMMISRDAWLPAVLQSETTVGHLLIDKDEGPLEGVMSVGTDDYMVNVRDLLLYGEQFINYNPAGAGFVALPLSSGQRRYAGADEAAALFTDAGGRFRSDGMVSLTIMGRQRETTRNLTLYKA